MAGLGQLWKRQPQAAALVVELVEHVTVQNTFLSHLSNRLLNETGTRLVDWVDHLALPGDLSIEGSSLDERLDDCGFNRTDRDGWSVFCNQQGMFPPIELTQGEARIALKVESVLDFLVAHQLSRPIIGQPFSKLRMACVDNANEIQVWVAERWGAIDWECEATPDSGRQEWYERVILRRRDFDNDVEGFEFAGQLILEGVDRLGVDEACALFFAAERRYWQSRNQAAQLQKARQDRLGMGWANHDHHTYRSSRVGFRHLVQCLKQLGFRYRERFYAGEEAGWGAQVMEQPRAAITVFADVDLAPEEIVEDFPEQGLEDRDHLGTVGLWCALHGEAFLQAGMHHLEGQFDFDAARQQLAGQGCQSMPPFTDFDYLKQCFTQGERWDVSPGRVQKLRKAGRITDAQAEQFLAQGAVGSHLEILQRDDGFKGFNQTGISDIIRKTDPRQLQL